MKHDAIQSQRETWLKSRIVRAEREKEREEGVARLDDVVARARAREAEEEAKLDDLIAGAKASYDEYKTLPQSMAAVSTEEAVAVESGAVFGVPFIEDATLSEDERRVGPPTARAEQAA